jgi:hypothetical protein
MHPRTVNAVGLPTFPKLAFGADLYLTSIFGSYSQGPTASAILPEYTG